MRALHRTNTQDRRPDRFHVPLGAITLLTTVVRPRRFGFMASSLLPRDGPAVDGVARTGLFTPVDNPVKCVPATHGNRSGEVAVERK